MGNQCGCWSETIKVRNMEVDVPQRESESNLEASKINKKWDSSERLKDLYNFLSDGKPEPNAADFSELKEDKRTVARFGVASRVTKKSDESSSSSGYQTPVSTRKSSQNSCEQVNQRNQVKPIKIYLTLLGESGVGKTSFIYKACYNQFDLYHIPTINPEQVMYETKYEGSNYQVQLIDTCGVAEYRSNLDELVLNADFLIYMVDLTNSRSFKYVKKLLDENKYKTGSDCLQKIILGNKADIAGRYKELKESVREYAKSAQIPYFEVSAKTNCNFAKFIKHCLEVFYNRA